MPPVACHRRFVPAGMKTGGPARLCCVTARVEPHAQPRPIPAPSSERSPAPKPREFRGPDTPIMFCQTSLRGIIA